MGQLGVLCSSHRFCPPLEAALRLKEHERPPRCACGLLFDLATAQQ